MGKIDVLNTIKGARQKINVSDIRIPLMDLAESLLAQDGFTAEERNKLARLRAYLDIHFK
jgi:hypothetical protein